MRAYKGAVYSVYSEVDSDTTSAPIIGFTTEWTVAGDATARTVTLPLVNTRTEGALAYNCIIDWGDGTATSTVTAYNDTDRIHTYAANGTYQIEITGTCEGWSFNNTGDKLKIRKIIDWGNSLGFNGFKYLYGAFYGCTNFTSIPTGRILASGTGVLSDGFYRTFAFCNFTTIPSYDIFYNHTAVTTHAFDGTFSENFSLTGCPANMFDVHTAVTTYAFNQLFYQCDLYSGIPTDLFRFNVNAGMWSFNQTFRNTAVTTIPVDLFRYNTLVTDYAFRDTFQACIYLTAIPVDLFRYNTLVAIHAFEGTFIGCISLTTVPTDLFRYNTLVSVSGFIVVFEGCINLETIPDDLFRYNALCSTQGFEGAFQHCDKLQINPNVFGADLAARFENSPVPVGLATMFDRSSFSGTQGTAPALWGVTFPDVIELSTRPTTLWVAGDIITGQSSGVTSTFIAWFGTWKIMVKNLSGSYTSDEVIGVTGTSAKLANQSAGYPIKTDAEVITNCFNGAGNSLTSISNYADIPVGWT